jgi:hypothetical protein
MATIRAGAHREKQFKIDNFLGVNEAPDGDSALKTGEAAVMRNWRVTKERNLRKRPGYKTIATIADGHPIRGMWRGYIDSPELLTNGKFDGNMSYWTSNGYDDEGMVYYWNYISGAAKCTYGLFETKTLTQTLTLTAGESYVVSLDADVPYRGSGEALTVTFGSMTGTYNHHNIGALRYTYTATSTGSATLAFSGKYIFDGTVDNVSVKRVLGTSPFVEGIFRCSVQWVRLQRGHDHVYGLCLCDAGGCGKPTFLVFAENSISRTEQITFRGTV